MIFIGFYTKNTPYEQVIKERLLPSLKKWQLKYDIQGVKNLGSWQKNTGFKPKFIMEMLLKHKEDIVFNDADASIEKYPQLFFDIPQKYDLAVCKMDWMRFWRGEVGERKELLSGTMLWRFTPHSIELLQKYIEKIEEQPNMLEQRVLENLLKEKQKCNVYDLPIEYCTIIKRNGTYPDYIKNPVILHYQASRKYKRNLINYENKLT